MQSRRMSKVSDTYNWEEICDLTDEDMENLLLFFPAGKVPTMEALKALRESRSANPPAQTEY